MYLMPSKINCKQKVGLGYLVVVVALAWFSVPSYQRQIVKGEHVDYEPLLFPALTV